MCPLKRLPWAPNADTSTDWWSYWAASRCNVDVWSRLSVKQALQEACLYVHKLLFLSDSRFVCKQMDANIVFPEFIWNVESSYISNAHLPAAQFGAKMRRHFRSSELWTLQLLHMSERRSHRIHADPSRYRSAYVSTNNHFLLRFCRHGWNVSNQVLVSSWTGANVVYFTQTSRCMETFDCQKRLSPTSLNKGH